MADSQDTPTLEAQDTEMEGAEEIEDDDETAAVPATQDPDAEDEPKAPINPQTRFLDYLRSPMIQLNIGSGTASATISAHRAILTLSPYFANLLADDDTTIADLPDEDLDAMGCFLQYQYTGEYFPRRLANQPDGLEHDPSVPSIDSTGDQLLKHAKVYTLAEKLELPDLQSLAHSKIHRINSTAIGEIAYARYVYSHSSPEDVTIRKPVAAFWATRSHVLRHEAEAEFKAMCLEYPQFGFDVLSLVLDAREKRAREREDVGGPSTSGTPAGKGRKRMRPSVNV